MFFRLITSAPTNFLKQQITSAPTNFFKQPRTVVLWSFRPAVVALSVDEWCSQQNSTLLIPTVYLRTHAHTHVSTHVPARKACMTKTSPKPSLTFLIRVLFNVFLLVLSHWTVMLICYDDLYGRWRCLLRSRLLRSHLDCSGLLCSVLIPTVYITYVRTYARTHIRK